MKRSWQLSQKTEFSIDVDFVYIWGGTGLLKLSNHHQKMERGGGGAVKKRKKRQETVYFNYHFSLGLSTK